MNASIGGELSEPTCRVYSMKQGPGGSKVIRKHPISGNSARAPKKNNIYIILGECLAFLASGSDPTIQLYA